jgi:hypothetical protein
MIIVAVKQNAGPWIMAKASGCDPREIIPEKLKQWCKENQRDLALVAPFQEVLDNLESIKTVLGNLEHKVLYEYDFPEHSQKIADVFSRAKLIIALGGDGFQNKVLRYSGVTPVLGILGDQQSVGAQLWGNIDRFRDLGFFISKSDLLCQLYHHKNNLQIPRFEVKLNNQVISEPTSHILLGADSITNMSKYRISFDDGSNSYVFKQSSSGVIFSSGLGVAAHLEAVLGHPIFGLTAGDKLALVKIISPHTSECLSNNTAKVFSLAHLKPDMKFSLVSRMHSGGKIYIDGDQNCGFDWNRGDEVEITLAKKVAKLFTPVTVQR